MRARLQGYKEFRRRERVKVKGFCGRLTNYINEANTDTSLVQAAREGLGMKRDDT
jgi:hypothetical protein